MKSVITRAVTFDHKNKRKKNNGDCETAPFLREQNNTHINKIPGSK